MSNRSANFTAEQIDLLLDSLKACPQLATGQLGGKVPTKHHQKLAWEAVAQQLNEIGYGSVKTGDQIRAKWCDLKYRVQKKARNLALKVNETGDVPLEETLTRTDKRVLSMCGPKVYEPLTDTSLDSSAVTMKLLPLNMLDLIIRNPRDARINTSRNDETQESCVTYVIQENTNESVEETEVVAENAITEASDCDSSNKIIVQEVYSESVREHTYNENEEKGYSGG